MATSKPQLNVYVDPATVRRLDWLRHCQKAAQGLPELSQSDQLRQMLSYAIGAWEAVYGSPPAEFEPLPGPQPPVFK